MLSTVGVWREAWMLQVGVDKAGGAGLCRVVDAREPPRSSWFDG